MDIRVEIEQDIPIDAEQLGKAVAQAYAELPAIIEEMRCPEENCIHNHVYNEALDDILNIIKEQQK